MWANEEPVPAPTWTSPVELTPVELTLAAPEDRSSRRAGVRWVAAAAATVLIVAAVVAVSRRDEAAHVVDSGPAPSSITEIPIARSFGVRGLAVTDDGVWVTSTFDEELYRVDPSSNFLVGGHLVEPCGHGWLDVNAKPSGAITARQQLVCDQGSVPPRGRLHSHRDRAPDRLPMRNSSRTVLADDGVPGR